MKIIDAIMVVLGVVSLIGAIILMYALGTAGAAVANVEGTLAGLPAPSDTASFFSFLRTTILLGWVWSIIVLVTSVYAIWSGIEKIRRNK